MNKITIPVSGMHCTSCEILLEKSIKKIPNVTKVDADEKMGRVEIMYDTEVPNRLQIESIITENGYSIGEAKRLAWISTDIDDYSNVLMTGIVLFLLYLIANANGWSFGSIGNVSSPTLGVAFLLGLTAGVSSCMALIGGLVLGMSAKWNKEHENVSSITRFTPHIYFHLGRILGFGLLGGLLGIFGSVIHFSNLFLGVTTATVGVVMLLLGLNLTNISPRLGSFSFKLPKFFGRNIDGKGSSKISTFATGAATFFLPCGFTLAMQAYAVSTGSFSLGALSMAFFALGTVPGLLSIGFISAILKGEWLKKFFTFTGVMVLLLGIFNLNNGYALVSLGIPKSQSSLTDVQSLESANLEIQEVRMTQDGSGYTPSSISIDAGKKIRWIITSKSQYTCSSQIIVPALGISKSLEEGTNTIEFIAPASGEIPFSCSMGMYRGKFVVRGGNVNSAGNTGVVSANTLPSSNGLQNLPAGGCHVTN